jgi:hypothetical protein
MAINTTDIIDFKWMAGGGGVLMDGSGDIALTNTTMDSVKDIVQTRLKADFDGWKLYNFGADLQSYMGGSVDTAMEAAIKRRVMTSLTSNDFLPSGSVSVQTLVTGGSMKVYVYVQRVMVTTATVDNTNNILTVVVS